jgi:MFS transporter, PPP family, 3-phenylpropionic acid transporter
VRKYIEANQGIVLRAIFFINTAAFGCWLTFFNIYLKEKIGFTTSQIGVLSSILPFGTLLILPIWGILADKFVRKNVFLIALFMSMILINGILLINNYYIFILFLFLFGSFYSPLTPMLDTIALDYVEQTGKDSYGEIRLWASAGWAFSTLVVGYLLREIDVKFVFPITSALFLVSGLIMVWLYKPLKVKRNIATLKFSHLGKIIIDSPRLIIFIFIILIYGILSAPVMLFINLYYNEIGAQSQHLGIAFTVQALCELPFFFYGKKILDRFGARRVMVFAMFITMVRMLLYGITKDPVLAIAIGGLHGITIALFMVSVIQQIHVFIPQEWRATGQSFIYIFYFGVGIALGYIWSGYLSELYSVQKTMLLMGGLISILILITVFIFYMFRNADQNKILKINKISVEK